VNGHLGTQHFHSEDVQSLAAYIFRTHIDDAFHTKSRADGGCGNAMLSGTSLSNDARFPDPSGK